MVVQDAEKLTNNVAINTTNASNKAKEAKKPKAAPAAPPDTKHKRGDVRSNSKVKRQQSEEVGTTKTSIKPGQKKKFRWAMDIENYLGTGNRRSDARIKVWEGPEYAADTSDSENSSNESMTDPTPPTAMSSTRRPRYVDVYPVEPFNNVSEFHDTAYDAASSTASGTDIVAGQTHPLFYHSSKRYYCNNNTPSMQKGSEFAHHQGKSQELKSTLVRGRHICKNSKRHQPPIFIQTNLKEDIASGQKSPRYTSTRPEPELSYTSADLRRPKQSDYDPVTVQAVGRGDFGIPLPKKRHTHTGSLENSPLEHTHRRRSSDPGTTTSDADHQYKKVKHAISDAISNAEWNKGLSSGRSGNASTSGERRCSIELAREKGKIPRSSESQESEPQFTSRYPKPIFVFRPDENDDGRRPLIVFETQHDYDELRKQHRRSRKQGDPSPPYPSNILISETRDKSRKKGASKTSPSYQRPYVSDYNGRSVHDGPRP